MNDETINAVMSDLPIMDQLRLASTALVNAMDEIVRLRGDLEIAVAYGDKLNRQLIALRIEEYAYAK